MGTFGVLPISYQSGGIPFSEWISLMTVCLAPLIAHIVAGVPRVVCLSQKLPSFWDRLTLYNPTTILWRYSAITERRIRAKAWNASDMAASNAYFWTSQGWNGSEEMIETSRVYLAKAPDRPRTTILSETSAKSIIVTVQGAQALYTLVTGTSDAQNYGNSLAVDSIFFPLALFGLLRLPAAVWLSEDYSYSEYEHSTSDLQPGISDLRTEFQPTAMRSLLHSDMSSGQRFAPARGVRNGLLRTVNLIPTLGLWLLCFYYLAPWAYFLTTLTCFLLILYFLVFLSATLVIYSYYFVYRRSTSTMIPCVSSTWYKIYTCLLFAMMIFMLVVSALETRRVPCGKYTTYPEIDFEVDESLCQGLIRVNGHRGLDVSTSSANQTIFKIPFGLATWPAYADNDRLIANKSDVQLMGFRGSCLGNLVPLNSSLLGA